MDLHTAEWQNCAKERTWKTFYPIIVVSHQMTRRYVSQSDCRLIFTDLHVTKFLRIWISFRNTLKDGSHQTIHLQLRTYTSHQCLKKTGGLYSVVPVFWHTNPSPPQSLDVKFIYLSNVSLKKISICSHTILKYFIMHRLLKLNIPMI